MLDDLAAKGREYPEVQILHREEGAGYLDQVTLSSGERDAALQVRSDKFKLHESLDLPECVAGKKPGDNWVSSPEAFCSIFRSRTALWKKRLQT